jgi:hypothetical protein
VVCDGVARRFLVLGSLLGLAFGWTDAFGQPRLRAQSHWEVTERFAEVTAGNAHKTLQGDIFNLGQSQWYFHKYLRKEENPTKHLPKDIVIAAPDEEFILYQQEGIVYATLERDFQCTPKSTVWLHGGHGPDPSTQECFACDPKTHYCKDSGDEVHLEAMQALQESDMGEVVDLRTLLPKEVTTWLHRHIELSKWLKAEIDKGKRCFILTPCFAGSSHAIDHLDAAMTSLFGLGYDRGPEAGPLEYQVSATAWFPREDTVPCPLHVRAFFPHDSGFQGRAGMAIRMNAMVALLGKLVETRHVKDAEGEREEVLPTVALLVISDRLNKQLEGATSPWEGLPMWNPSLNLTPISELSKEILWETKEGNRVIVTTVHNSETRSTVKAIERACKAAKK